MSTRGLIALILAGVAVASAVVLMVAAWPSRDVDYACQEKAVLASPEVVHEGQLNEARGSWRVWPTRIECRLPTADGSGTLVVPIAPDLSAFTAIGALATAGAVAVAGSGLWARNPGSAASTPRV